MRAIFLGCYTPHAMKGLIGGSDREAAVKALLKSVGGKFVSLSFTRGEYDVALVADLPDQSSSVGLTMAIQASGAFTKMTVLEELDMRPVIAAAKKAAKTYKPAG
jgi:uncharacterized protein with GYD domain